MFLDYVSGLCSWIMFLDYVFGACSWIMFLDEVYVVVLRVHASLVLQMDSMSVNSDVYLLVVGGLCQVSTIQPNAAFDLWYD